MVCTAPSGILVCIPRGGVSAQEFEEAETSGYVGAIGPFSEVEVAVSNSRAKRTLAAIIFDLDIRGSAAIVERVPDGFPRESVVRFNIYRGAEDLPNRAARGTCHQLHQFWNWRRKTGALLLCSRRWCRARRGRDSGSGSRNSSSQWWSSRRRRSFSYGSYAASFVDSVRSHSKDNHWHARQAECSRVFGGSAKQVGVRWTSSCSSSTSAQIFTPDVRWSRCNVGARTTSTSASFGRQRTQQVGRPRSSQSTQVSSSTQYGCGFRWHYRGCRGGRSRWRTLDRERSRQQHSVGEAPGVPVGHPRKAGKLSSCSTRSLSSSGRCIQFGLRRCSQEHRRSRNCCAADACRLLSQKPSERRGWPLLEGRAM